MNNLIFGNDPTEKIVNLTLKDEKIHIYKQQADGQVICETESYSPFVLSHGKIRPYSEKLKGNQYWDHMTTTSCEKFLGLQEKWARDLWLPRSIEETYTLVTGTTYYKGMKVQDVSVLSFDIETNGLTINADSYVYLITNTFRDSNGKITRKLFNIEDYGLEYGDGAAMLTMIGAWCEWVRKMDPSIICGHNIMSYDLPFLAHCYEDELPLGRDGSGLTFATRDSKFRKDAQQQYLYKNARITGREIVDTLFLSIKHDMTAREFPSYGLKPIIKHLGLEKEGRSFIDAGRISQYFDNRDQDPTMWDKVKQYASEDSDDALTLFDKFIPPFFYMCNSIPKTLQQMIGEATGSQLDALMIRSYLQDGYSQPRTSTREAFEGAVSFSQPGMYDWVAKADVAALYPSIMLQYDIYDKDKDPNRHLLVALEYYREERLKAKQKFKETKDAYYDGIQAAFKILANSIYGFTGSNYLLYNYPKGAAEVTKRGREVLQTAIKYATGYEVEKVVKHVRNAGTDDEEIEMEWKLSERNGVGQGFDIVGGDTDSIWITNGKEFSKEQFKAFLQNLNNTYPEKINFEDDGIYSRFIVLKTKNYITVKDGELKLKGSGLVDTKKEFAIREMMKKMFQALVANEVDSLPVIYKDYVKEVTNIQDINRWCSKKTVTQSVLHPERLTEQKILNAIKEACEKGALPGYQEGDKVWVYNALKGEKQTVAKGEPVFYKDGRPKMEKNTVLRHPTLWENDHDVEHYLGRLVDAVEILENVVSTDMFPDYSKKSMQSQLKDLT